MNYQKTKDKNFLGKWRYQAQFAYYFDYVKQGDGKKVEKWRTPEASQGVASIEFFLKSRAIGGWLRVGNNFYFDSLTDIYHIRMYFDDDLKFIREAGSYQKPTQA